MAPKHHIERLKSGMSFVDQRGSDKPYRRDRLN